MTELGQHFGNFLCTSALALDARYEAVQTLELHDRPRDEVERGVIAVNVAVPERVVQLQRPGR